MSKLILVAIVYLIWVPTCRWVNQDTQDLKLDNRLNWNVLVVGCGFAGFLVLWFLPTFFLGFVALLACFLTSSLVYVNVRNKEVPVQEKVLTVRHLKDLAERYLRLRLARGPVERVAADGPSIRFFSKNSKHSDGSTLVARASRSRGFRAAAEMVYEAIRARATDIHMEPTREEMTVRYRIDGILTPGQPFSRQMGDAVVNIFKVICEMDITEKRKPQDGSCSAEVDDRVVDFRVATSGSVSGEKLVMRILDKGKSTVTLSSLGMRDKLREQVHQIAQQPHGMMIVCGPTGAGKSTTLYACLNEIDRYQKNVITVENPVEMQIENVTQIEINPKQGKTFAGELRSILRQDPDVILIGEIRDAETAEIACQAAQTGHMVFSTVHANDTVTALVRLIDLGVQGFTLASAVSAILGQRLVRVLCPHCKVRYKPNAEMLRKANLPADKIKFFYRPADTVDANGADDEDDGQDGQGAKKRCEHCGGTGYKGRTGVFELLVINDRIRELIRDDPNPNLIKQEAVKNGMKYLQEDGLRQVIEGKTSIQELLRVCK